MSIKWTFICSRHLVSNRDEKRKIMNVYRPTLMKKKTKTKTKKQTNKQTKKKKKKILGLPLANWY